MDNPRVSIGLPVHNGENYLREALDSILIQDYQDFELIVSDNASSDHTPDIIQEYAKREERIRSYRFDRNVGAAANFNRVFELARGEYFKWAAHDDLILPTFINKAVTALDRDPAIALCFCGVQVIDRDGRPTGMLFQPPDQAAAPSPSERFRALVLNDLECHEVFGLIRTSVLRRTGLIRPFVASDRTLRAELGLLGSFHYLPEYLFLSRDHPGRSVRAWPAHHLRAAWFDPTRADRRVLPHWRIFLEYWKCINMVLNSPTTRRQCRRHLACWPFHNMNWAWLLTDFIIALKPDSWRLIFRHRKAR